MFRKCFIFWSSTEDVCPCRSMPKLSPFPSLLRHMHTIFPSSCTCDNKDLEDMSYTSSLSHFSALEQLPPPPCPIVFWPPLTAGSPCHISPETCVRYFLPCSTAWSWCRQNAGIGQLLFTSPFTATFPFVYFVVKLPNYHWTSWPENDLQYVF